MGKKMHADEQKITVSATFKRPKVDSTVWPGLAR